MLVVDDFAPFRRVISLILKEMEDIQVVGEASDGWEAVLKAAELQPDLILLDIGLPKMDGIQAARKIYEFLPGSRVIFVSQEMSADVLEEALATGAQGFVTKVDAWNDLVKAVKSVLRGERFVSSRLEDGNLT